MLKKILNILKYIALVAACVGLVINFIWANMQADTRVCNAVDIDIENADTVSFVNQAILRDMLNKANLNPTGMNVTDIDTDTIEKFFANSEYLESAECVMMKNGDIHIYTSQLIPVMRVFDGGESFYVNKDGKSMRATSSIHTNTPIVNGHFNDPADALIVLPIAKYVESEPALSELVTMYTVKDKNNIIIIPSIRGHVINFGDSTNIANKFAKLKRFYKEVMPVKGWDTYDTISLKWNYQVVANRRSKRIKPVLVVDSTLENEAPAIESLIIPQESAQNEKPVATANATNKPAAKTSKTTKKASPTKKVNNAFAKKKKSN